MEAAIVHFPHPGGEHDAKRKQPVFPWNTGRHHRKYLRSPGVYIGSDGERVMDDLVFWGEWEAASRVAASWPSEGKLPTYLHEPFWTVPETDDFRQNTDPWVFGDRFRYSNCKQLSQAALRQLPRGSLILFGSTVTDHAGTRRFVLDTCFVTADSVSLTDGMARADEAFDTCTIQSLGEDASACRLHHGATSEAPVEEMFSFVPCLPANDENPRFARPSIELSGYINPKSVMSPSGAKTRLPIEEVQRTWHAVVEQVRSQELELGVRFETPPRHDGSPI